jgi:competence protein CoiA
MMIAIAPNGARIPATPGMAAYCPSCHEPLRPKCGQIVSWHWAHAGRDDCDEWAEPNTAWHHYWQAMVSPNQCEISLGPHRADIQAHDGTIVEIQHSSISVEEIREREVFYGRMVWIFDAREAYSDERLDLRHKGPYYSFRWKHPRKSVGACRKPIFLDLGNGLLFRVKKIHTTAPCGGWGLLTEHKSIAAWMNNGDREARAALNTRPQGEPDA